MTNLKDCIRSVPDFPKPGILFRDIQPLLMNPTAFKACIEQLAEQVAGRCATKIGGLDARGFLFGPAVAERLGIPFFPVRKAGKLPPPTTQMSYGLEYGKDTIEIAEDAVGPGDRVALIDDLLATGGTLDAAAKLVYQAGGTTVLYLTVIELVELGGRTRLESSHDCPVVSLIAY